MEYVEKGAGAGGAMGVADCCSRLGRGGAMAARCCVRESVKTGRKKGLRPAAGGGEEEGQRRPAVG